MRLLERMREMLRPPRIVAVTRRPAGWFAVGRGGLRDVIAWAQFEDGQVVGLVAGRRGLSPAAGRGFHGYLPAAPHSASDIQLSPPAVSFPAIDLVEAIGDAANPWTSEAEAVICGRLKLAAESEWATSALISFVTDPEKFLRRYFESQVEHAHPAELDDDWRAGLATINDSPAYAGIQEEK